MSGPRAGRLKDKVTIQKPPTTKDSYGQPTGSWITVVTDRSCSIEPLNGREYWSGNTEHAETTTVVRFRYQKNIIKSGYRLIDYRTSPATVYDIEGQPIDPGNEHRELICKCKVRE